MAILWSRGFESLHPDHSSGFALFEDPPYLLCFDRSPGYPASAEITEILPSS